MLLKKQFLFINMDNFSQRLQYALEITGTRKVELARKINVKPQVIQFLCNSTTQSSRYTFDIAEALNINVEWLALGKGNVLLDKSQKNTIQAPILDYQNLRDLFLHHKKLSEIVTLNKLPYLTDKKTIFALEMLDSSMHPILQLNSYLFFDSEDIALKNESIYLIYANKYDSFLVREYLDSPDKYMAPRNYELFNKTLVNDDMLILGKLIASLKQFS